MGNCPRNWICSSCPRTPLHEISAMKASSLVAGIILTPVQKLQILVQCSLCCDMRAEVSCSKCCVMKSSVSNSPTSRYVHCCCPLIRVDSLVTYLRELSYGSRGLLRQISVTAVTIYVEMFLLEVCAICLRAPSLSCWRCQCILSSNVSDMYIPEVLVSNLSHNTGYPDCFRDFHQCLQANTGIVPL